MDPISSVNLAGAPGLSTLREQTLLQPLLVTPYPLHSWDQTVGVTSQTGVGRHMLRVLMDIETIYGVPQGTMRSAISRGVVSAEKRGKIVMVDDTDPTFRAYLQSYQPRGGRTLQQEGHPEPASTPAAPVPSSPSHASSE